MTGHRDRIIAQATTALIGAAACVYVLAQPTHAPAVGQVNPQVNTALYGGGVPASVRYANPAPGSSVAMPSEVRYAIWSSGATPSELRMNYAAMGPLHPEGPIAYVPAARSFRSNAPPPPPMGAAAFSSSSVRYSSPPASSTAVAPRPVSPAPISPGPINTAIANPGAVRYAR